MKVFLYWQIWQMEVFPVSNRARFSWNRPVLTIDSKETKLRTCLRIPQKGYVPATKYVNVNWKTVSFGCPEVNPSRDIRYAYDTISLQLPIGGFPCHKSDVEAWCFRASTTFHLWAWIGAWQTCSVAFGKTTCTVHFTFFNHLTLTLIINSP